MRKKDGSDDIYLCKLEIEKALIKYGCSLRVVYDTDIITIMDNTSLKEMRL